MFIDIKRIYKCKECGSQDHELIVRYTETLRRCRACGRTKQLTRASVFGKKKRYFDYQAKNFQPIEW